MRSKAWSTSSPLWSNVALIAAAASLLTVVLAAPAAAASPTISEFSVPTANAGPSAIAAGHDGNLWFTESTANQIGRITPKGKVTEFPLPTPNSGPAVITAGPDGNLWFTESSANRIGRITPAGTVTEFPIPTPNSVPAGITAGPDGNVWFTELGASQIGRITPLGGISEYPVAPDDLMGPRGITVGPDGNIWFTVGLAHVGRITPVGDVRPCWHRPVGTGCSPGSTSTTAAEFAVPEADNGLADIVAGPDGNLWLAGGDPQILTRIDTAGTGVSTITVGDRCDCQPLSLAIGPDGNLWFAGRISTSRTDGVGRVVPATGALTRFTTPTRFWSICCAPTGLAGATAGPDGNLWFTEGGANQIGQLRLGP